VLGRDATADIRINSPKISRTHLRFDFKNGAWLIQDLNSSNGTFFNSKNIEELIIESRTTIYLGGSKAFMLLLDPLKSNLQNKNDDSQYQDATVITKFPISKKPTEVEDVSGRIRLQDRIRIGRDAKNDWVIPSLSVSRFHAEIMQSSSGTFEIVDMKSANGTFVNNEQINRHQLVAGDLITLGAETRKFTNSGLEPLEGIRGTNIVLDEISYSVGDKTLISEASIEIAPGSLTAIIGPSGAGKSTLLNLIAGQLKPKMGRLLFAGNNFEEFRKIYGQRIGYVPQSDILHTQLTTRKALEYGAALRLPSDTSKAEQVTRVQEVLDKLELTQRANLKISKLSGGQRKRASIGLELLTSPDVLLLDEPTSGLDPGLDAHVMEILRALADDGQTVILVTHSVDNLHYCDNVILMASGGHVAYSGPASTVFSALKRKNWSEVFKFLASPEAVLLSQPNRNLNQSNNFASSESLVNRRTSWIKQVVTLSKRYAKVIASDVFYLTLLAATPILTGALCYISGSKYGFGIGYKTKYGFWYNPFAQGTLLVLVLGSIFIGLATGIQEIVKESDIRKRENGAGVKPSAYIASKVLVLGSILLLQELAFTFIVLFGRPMQDHGLFIKSARLEIIFISFILAFTSLCLALLISTLLSSPEQAMPALVGFTMIELVLSGALPIATNGLINTIAKFSPSYWATNGIAASTNLLQIAQVSSATLKSRWVYATSNVTNSLLVNLVFLTICVALAYLQVRRKR
jgi:ABC-type multidrug transport system ATPase subunit/pSer/pThr/pTyr-binding forkhead associated (FHA) protein